MPYVTLRYERAKPYEEVWAEAVTTVAKRYGISDVALRKICRKLAVPLPPLGYWAKIAAGKKHPTPPLPKYSGPAEIVRQRALSNCRFKKRVSSICEGDSPSIASIHFSAAQSSITHCMGIDSADYPPRLELLHHLVPIMACPHQVPPTPNVIRHLPMRGQKSLRMFHRLEPSHTTFPFPSWLMRVLRPIIESPATAVLDLWNQFTMCARVARQFIGD